MPSALFLDRVSSDVTYTYTYAAVSSPTTEPPYIPVPKPGTPEVSNPGYTPSPNIIIHEDSDSGDDDDDDEDTDIDTDEDSDLDEEPSAGSDPNDTNVPEKDTVVYTVIFKVVYGAWNDKTKEDKIVTLEGASGEILYLRQEDIPAVGGRRAEERLPLCNPVHLYKPGQNLYSSKYTQNTNRQQDES